MKFYYKVIIGIIYYISILTFISNLLQSINLRRTMYIKLCSISKKDIF